MNLISNYEAVEQVRGLTIQSLGIDNEVLFVEFEGGALQFTDDGQSCCENRWMNTDDDLGYYVGAKIWDAEVREGPWYEALEVQEQEFLVITTDRGAFTVVNYNEHNGYYGGFDITATWEPD